MKNINPEKYHIIDLLDFEQEELYRADPTRLERFSTKIKWIFIDAVQKMPKLYVLAKGSFKNI